MASGNDIISDKCGTTSHKGEKVRAYTVAFKLEAVTHAENSTNGAASVKFNVDRKRIREWRKKKEELAGMGIRPGAKKRNRLDGGGRKPLSDVLEETMLEWITTRRSKRLHVSRKVIRVKAKVRIYSLLGQFF